MKELDNLVNMGRLVQKFLPKQADIDKIFKIIQQKIIKGTHLPMMIKEIQVGYLAISYFTEIYICIYPRISSPVIKWHSKRLKC